MKPKTFGAFLTGLVALGASIPLWAHHSFAAAYDLNHPVSVTGVITKVRLQNPHSWFFLEVKNQSGKVENWAFEAGTPSGMIRNGYKPDVIKEGATVTIKGFHAHDPAETKGMLRELILPDGKVYGMFGPTENK